MSTVWIRTPHHPSLLCEIEGEEPSVLGAQLGTQHAECSRVEASAGATERTCDGVVVSDWVEDERGRA
jgi:hypothetical protein